MNYLKMFLLFLLKLSITNSLDNYAQSDIIEAAQN